MDKQTNNVRTDVTTIIFNIIRETLRNSKDNTCKKSDLTAKIISRGFTEQQLDDTILQYVNINVLYLDQSGSEISMV